MKYCATFILHFNTKNKIDYSIIPVDQIDETMYRSQVAPETILTNTKGIYADKESERFIYRKVFNSDKSLDEAEKDELPIIEKEIKRRIFFKFAMKKKLSKRIKEILNS